MNREIHEKHEKVEKILFKEECYAIQGAFEVCKTMGKFRDFSDFRGCKTVTNFRGCKKGDEV
jgi:hypothetical protein